MKMNNNCQLEKNPTSEPGVEHGTSWSADDIIRAKMSVIILNHRCEAS